MILVRVSPHNLLCTRLMMEEKGKVVNLETDEEEEDLEDLIIEEDEDEGMEEETEPAHPPTKLLAYIPPQKGRTKVTKDPDSRKFVLSTPLLLEQVEFEGPRLARISVLKMEDSD